MSRKTSNPSLDPETDGWFSPSEMKTEEGSNSDSDDDL